MPRTRARQPQSCSLSYPTRQVRHGERREEAQHAHQAVVEVLIAFVGAHGKIDAGGGGFEIGNVEAALDAPGVEVDAVTAPGAGDASGRVAEVVYEAAEALSLSASGAQIVYSLLNPYRYEVLDESSVHDAFGEDRR